MITQFTVEFGINSTCNAINSIRLHLMLFRPLLMLLIPNTTVNCAITYMNRYHRVASCTVPLLKWSPLSSYILKELFQKAFFTHLTNDTSGHSWIRVYKEDSVVLVIFLGCQQANTFHNVILLSVMQWSGKLLQNITVLWSS